MGTKKHTQDFSDVFRYEQRLIREHRLCRVHSRSPPAVRKKKKAGEPMGEAVASPEPQPDEIPDLRGLALSGGGIRSAAFCFGVLNALKDTKHLDRIDYLSTVSGGGYIASALSWLNCNRRTSRRGSVEERFPEQQARQPVSDWTAPGKWIRLRGDYLRPTPGLGGASLFAVVLRNLSVSAIVGLCFLTAVFFLAEAPSIAWKSLTGNSATGKVGDSWKACAIALSLIFVLLGFAYGLACRVLAYLENSKPSLAHFFYSFRVRWQVIFGAIFTYALVAYCGWMVSETSSLFYSNTDCGNFMTFSRPGLLAFVGFLGVTLEFGFGKIEDIAGSSAAARIRLYAWAALFLFGLLVVSAKIGISMAWSTLRPDAPVCHVSGSNLLGISLVLTGIALGLVIDSNHSGLHRMYRDRLMESFMPGIGAIRKQESTPDKDSNTITLHDVHNRNQCGPLHLLNAHLVLVNSRNPVYKGRGGSNFVLSPAYCGGDAVGWTKSDMSPFRGLTLATAMAISGAALNPKTAGAGKGPTRNPLISTLLSLTNMRLGYWLPNPRVVSRIGLLSYPNFLTIGLWQVLPHVGYDTDSRFIELTDGGHFENTGLYELFRRRLPTVILADAGADPELRFSDLAVALERAKSDFNIKVLFREPFSLAAMLRNSDKKNDNLKEQFQLSENSFALADIEYPATTRLPASSGVLILIKPLLTRETPIEVLSFKRNNDSFPHTTTADQFFDESKFDAYRELGYNSARQALAAAARQSMI